MIQLETTHINTFIFDDPDELQRFANLIYKLKNKPASIGFAKRDLTEDDISIIEQLYSLLDISEIR